MFVPENLRFFKNEALKDRYIIIDVDQYEIKNTDTYQQATEKELNLKNKVMKNFFKKDDS